MHASFSIWLIGPWVILMKFYINDFEVNLVIGGWGISYDIALRWFSLYLRLTDEKSTLVQVMAWCHRAVPEPVNPDLCCHIASLGDNKLTKKS